MKTAKKFSAAILSAIMILSLFTACGGGGGTKDDVPVSDISTAVDSAIGNTGNLVSRDENYIKNMIGIDSGSYVECVVMVNAYGTSFDEYGVFKGKDSSQAQEISKLLEAYLESAKGDTLRFSYTPEEQPKVENAEVKTVGNYVMYTILADDSKTAAFSALESSVKEG